MRIAAAPAERRTRGPEPLSRSTTCKPCTGPFQTLVSGVSRVNSELNTKERLLEAAHSLFAERGYHNATVRDIAARARTNLASINYYFRSKDDLYREVMHRSYRKIVETAQVGAETICERGTSPEEKLRLFVRGLIPTTEAGAEEDQHTRLVA